jgi:hypothetical protein
MKCEDCKHWTAFEFDYGVCPEVCEYVQELCFESGEIATHKDFGCKYFKDKNE